jgi:DNA-binding protein HU-beta
MNKQELVDAMAESTGSTKADAKKSLDAFIEAVSGALKKGDRISLVGFGSYSVAERSAREGRNPQTGKTIKIAAKKVVKFKAGTELATNVNKGK